MSEVKLLKPNDAGLADQIQLFEDGIRTEAKSGSYEWWYFDSKFADGSRDHAPHHQKYHGQYGNQY